MPHVLQCIKSFFGNCPASVTLSRVYQGFPPGFTGALTSTDYWATADPAWTIEVRSKLRVSRASLFNYKDGTDLASLDVLKRAHEELGFSFPYMDFSAPQKPRTSRAELKKAQGAFSFLEPLRREHIRVVSKKTVDSQTLELTMQIRFPSRMAALRKH